MYRIPLLPQPSGNDTNQKPLDKPEPPASIVGDAKRSLGLLRTLGAQDCGDLLRVAGQGGQCQGSSFQVVLDLNICQSFLQEAPRSPPKRLCRNANHFLLDWTRPLKG